MPEGTRATTRPELRRREVSCHAKYHNTLFLPFANESPWNSRGTMLRTGLLQFVLSYISVAMDLEKEGLLEPR